MMLPPALRLAAQLATPSPPAVPMLAEAIEEVDPNELLRILRHHRLEPLAAQRLSEAGLSLPAPFQGQLTARARAAAQLALVHVAEGERLNALLQEAGCTPTWLKGSTLAILAHDSLALKSSWDMDVLVPMAQVEPAEAVLRSAGYQRVAPPADASPDELAAHRAARHESVWSHPGRGTAVEMHWRLSANRALLNDAEAAPRQMVAMPGGGGLATLAPGPLYAFLALHGASHGWNRLHWLADLAALIARNPGQVEHWHQEATRRHLGACSGAALLLCERLFATSLPRRVADRFGPRARLLADLALRLLSRGGGGHDLSKDRAGVRLLLLSKLLQGGSLRGVAGAAGELFYLEDDRQRLPLPAKLSWLYPTLRLPMALWRAGRRRLRPG